MFETIFGVLLQGVTVILDAIIKWFTMQMELDLDAMFHMFPFLATMYTAFQTIAMALIVIIAAFNIGKFFLPGIAEVKEKPSMILLRAGISAGLVYFGGYIISAMVRLASFPYRAFLEMSGSLDAMTGGGGALSLVSFGDVAGNIGRDILGAVTGAPYLLMCLIVVIMFAFNLLKLILEICERYLMVGVLAYASPLAFSTITAQGASMVFQRWFSMLFGQCLLMTLSAASFDLVLSGIYAVNSDGTNLLIKLILLMGACRIGCRLDTHLQQLGIGVGTTGGSLMDEMMALARTAMSFSRFSGHGKGAAGGAAKDGILGGAMRADGSVVPEASGHGLMGGAWTAMRRGFSAYKNGASVENIKSQAVQGFKDGTGINFDIKKGATVGEQVQNAVKANATAPITVGRKMSSKLQGFAHERNAARSPITREKTGTATMSADGSKANLNDVAKQNGLSIGKNGEINGKSSKTVGEFMQTNLNNPAAIDMIDATARTGSNEASESALFSGHNQLEYDPDSGIDQAKFDQTMSDMSLSTFGDDMEGLESREEEALDEQRGVIEAYRAMRDSMTGDYSNGKLADIKAGDVDGDPDKGRELTAELQTEQGTQYGQLSIKDQKAFDNLTDEQKKGYVPLSSATGQQYYAKATGVSINGKPEAINNPMKDIKGMGASTTSVGGKEVLNTTDTPRIDAQRINSLMGSKNATTRKIAENTASSDIACPPEVAKAALFDAGTGAVGTGHDAPMAAMMQTAIPAESLNEAATTLRTEDGVQIAPDDAAHFSEAVAATARGEMSAESGYSFRNITKDEGGVVRGEYVTPSGDTYGVAFQQESVTASEPSQFPQDSTPVEYIEEYAGDGQGPDVGLDDIPSDDELTAATPVQPSASAGPAISPGEYVQSEQVAVRISSQPSSAFGGSGEASPSIVMRSEPISEVHRARETVIQSAPQSSAPSAMQEPVPQPQPEPQQMPVQQVVKTEPQQPKAEPKPASRKGGKRKK